MASRARLGLRTVVRLVTGLACAVLRRREDGLVLVTALAPRDGALVERVRRVTRRALRVVRGERAFVDVSLALLRRVTARATRVGREEGLVHLVAVEAATRAGVVRLLLVRVALGTRLRGERRRLVRAMAISTWLIGVRADGLHVPALGLLVTAHARRRLHRGVLAEAVAALTAEVRAV